VHTVFAVFFSFQSAVGTKSTARKKSTRATEWSDAIVIFHHDGVAFVIIANYNKFEH
jgi:hypothetical protein